MLNKRKIACVTGASGIVGKRIVERLVEKGYTVRALCRKTRFIHENIHTFFGDIGDIELLHQFVLGADEMYHCAAELFDESKMWEVNYEGTRKVLNATKNSGIKYFLYVSSAGVIGSTDSKNPNERTICNPSNTYEISKWEAEKIVSAGIDECRVVIIRPTNIIDNTNLGVLEVIHKNRIINRFFNFLRSSECAHIVHAIDVADAAIFLNDNKLNKTDCFFVSIDDDPLNSFHQLKLLYKKLIYDQASNAIFRNIKVPIIIPYILRRIKEGKSNWGDVKFSSDKLLQHGFKFSYNIKKSVTEVLSINLGLRTLSTDVTHQIKSTNKIKLIAVIGATGFIGRNLIEKLSCINNLRINLLIQNENQSSLFNTSSNINFFIGNLLDKKSIEKVLIQDCIVINLAYIDTNNRNINLMAIENLIEACTSIKIKKLIHCSTANVVGNVQNDSIDENTFCDAKTNYETTKLMIESKLIKSAKGKYEVSILRPTAVFGPGGKNLVKLASNLTNKSWLKNYLISCFYGRRSMNLVSIDNVISAILFLCKYEVGEDDNIFIISDDNFPKNSFIDIEYYLMEELSIDKYPLPRIPFPPAILKIFLIIFRRPITNTKRKFNCDKIMRLGYEKTSTVNEELHRFARWYKKEFNLN